MSEVSFRNGDIVFYVPSDGKYHGDRRFVGLIIANRFNFDYNEDQFKVVWYRNGERHTDTDGLYLSPIFLVKIGSISPWRKTDIDIDLHIEVYDATRN